ncbi:MAG: hypothetical protein EPO06_00200 [Burkholderiaceae bacterium]|nr:MAG: hypothetical protein EPO06_00200 [Burkholderiaceae bacterium]
MTDAEFEDFVQRSMDELIAKQDQLKSEYGFGTFDRWHFEQTSETLSFFDADGKLTVEAEVIDIGSYANNSNTWKWAWANDTILPALRSKAEPLRNLQELTGFELFGSDSTVSVEDENMAWELAAMSVRQLGALGAYKAPSSSRPLATFLAIMRIKRCAA